ncbi:hypothetical protein [Fibrella forsythiae]|uniref:DUF4375 domain-containing protein n=1 Tax=Fibrella forsythiae TaxID=2817061 RepID=A0ABS3JAR0_9BACT|nr:hypothetical protein [Fibrella forsythiae]MBO0947065.1 hypothetical protein [Fibrella forsythiae]
MLRFFLLLTVFVSADACHLRRLVSSDEEILLLIDRKMLGEDGTLRRSLSDVWVNTSAFCQSEQSVDCVIELDNLQHELNDLDPVPVPQPGARLPVSADEATKLYKDFVGSHQGEPILAVFQQLYPRILLNKYGIKTSGDYAAIAYFATEMAHSNALDFDLRTELLSILKGHIPNESYATLVCSTLEAAKREAVRQNREKIRLQSLIALNPKEFVAGDPDTYATASHRRLLRQYERSSMAAIVTRLTQWQQEPVN